MRFTERWYRFVVKAFPNSDAGADRSEVLTTLRDTGRLDARLPSLRESVLLTKGGYQVRAGHNQEPLRPMLLSGVALGSVLYLGFAWVRHLTALSNGSAWGYEPTVTDWIIVAVPVVIALAAAPIRFVRVISVVVFTVLLVTVTDRTVSDLVLVEGRGWVEVDVFRLLRFAAPLAVIALAGQSVTTVAGPVVSFIVGGYIGFGYLNYVQYMPIRNPDNQLVLGIALVAWAFITPVPLIAMVTAGSFVMAGDAVRFSGRWGMSIAVAWVVALAVVFVVRALKVLVGSSRWLSISRE